MANEELFEGSGSERIEGDAGWEETDDRSHSVCFENVSVGRKITEDGMEPGIRLGFHEHMGLAIAIGPDDEAEVSRIVQDLWLHIHPMHAYDLFIGLLRALCDAEDAGLLNWDGYRWPMRPNDVIVAMRALAGTIYPDFDAENPESPPNHEGVHNDPTNS